MQVAQPTVELEPAQLVEMLRRMQLVRAFDSRLPELYTAGLIRGSSHAALGQEAVAVGASAALAADDYVTSTHRGHGHTIAKGGSVDRMMCELLGREDGYCRGKGGSMHIADFSIGMLGANGIVGGGIGIAAGAALSASMRESSQVALCFFGDGAINQGVFHEASNIAAIWKLPLVLLCENNQFAMSARASQMSAGELSARAVGYGIPGCDVDGMDVLAVYAAARDAVERARAGAGPSLVVATCYRYEGHFSGDLMRYRAAAEAEEWVARDPVRAFAQRLVEDGVLTEQDVAAGAAAAEETVSGAVGYARAQPFPPIEAASEDLDA